MICKVKLSNLHAVRPTVTPAMLYALCTREKTLWQWQTVASTTIASIVYDLVCFYYRKKGTNQENKGLISEDRSNEATLPLTIPRSIFK